MHASLFSADPFVLACDDVEDNGVKGSPTIRSGYLSEIAAISRLISTGHAVAVPVVDDEGVDLVVNYRTTVQVKRRNTTNKAKGRNRIGCYDFRMPGGRSYYTAAGVLKTRILQKLPDVMLFHASDIDVWWVAPREVLHRHGIDANTRNILLSLHYPTPKYGGKFGALAEETREAWHFFD